MNFATAGTEHYSSWQKEAGPLAKPTKACAPCHARKVKCDATLKGLPCSGCVSRQCPESCVLSARKRRRRTENTRNPRRKAERLDTREDESALSTRPNYATDSGQSNIQCLNDDVHTESYSHCQPTPDSLDCQDSRQSQPELHYLNILKDAVDDPVSTQQHGHDSVASTSPRQEDTLASQIRLLYRPPQLGDFSREFLTRKGVFDLPPQHHLDGLLKSYFDYVYPYSPVIDRVDFLRSYRLGNYSLFLLYAMLASATLHAPLDVISGCGFEDRSSAQASSNANATLLHDFQVETDLLPLLQGSTILGMLILDHPTDKDFHYWFYNAIRLAVKLDIHKASIREDRSSRFSRLYRRIWWVLYCRDIFLHMYSGTRTLRLIGNDPHLKPITKYDWEPDEIPRDFQLLILPISNRQKSYFIAVCELAQIVSRLVSIITHNQEKDPRQTIRPLDTWRMSLADKMQMRDPSPEGDIYHAELLGSSYRFESTICRLICHSCQASDAIQYQWAKERLRAAIFELDAISRRISANGTIQKFPVSFMTAIPTLLALHIESALDTSETDLIRSMARISIGQTMLVLNELKEIPVIKRAIPIFKLVLAKKNIHPYPLATSERDPVQTPVDDQGGNESDAVQLQPGAVLSQDVQADYTAFLGDFMDFDVLDRWEIGQLDFSGVNLC